MNGDAMLRYYLMKTKAVLMYNEPKWRDMSDGYKTMIKSTAEYQFFVLNTNLKRLSRAILKATGIMKLLAQPRKDR